MVLLFLQQKFFSPYYKLRGRNVLMFAKLIIKRWCHLNLHIIEFLKIYLHIFMNFLMLASIYYYVHFFVYGIRIKPEKSYYENL